MNPFTIPLGFVVGFWWALSGSTALIGYRIATGQAIPKNLLLAACVVGPVLVVLVWIGWIRRGRQRFHAAIQTANWQG